MSRFVTAANRLMSGPRAFFRFCLVGALSALVLLGGLPSLAQTFTVYSQNTLRLANNAKTVTKCNAFKNALAAADIAVLQEVMNTGGLPSCLPPGGMNLRTYGPFGPNRYKEYYAVFYIGHSANTTVTWKQDYTAGGGFMRNPSGALFEITDTATPKTSHVWVIDFHAIWGKSVTQRRTEAANMNGVYNALRTAVVGGLVTPANGWPVIIAGDWNLPANDTGFSTMTGNNVTISPNVATTLTKTGGASQAYDHFAFSPDLTLNASNTFKNGMTAANWRSNISDHLGLVGNFTFQ